jgi:abortive infection bacteriophage resistance protein
MKRYTEFVNSLNETEAKKMLIEALNHLSNVSSSRNSFNLSSLDEIEKQIYFSGTRYNKIHALQLFSRHPHVENLQHEAANFIINISDK